MEHKYQSSVDLWMQPTFGAKCSCGQIHPGTLNNDSVEMDIQKNWSPILLKFINKAPAEPLLIRQGHWGMVRV